MADQVTANFGFVKPTPSDPGGAALWGVKLNANFDAIDAAIQGVKSSVGAPSNKLNNASFLVNQRLVSGTVNLAASAYGHDRWKAGGSGASYSFAASGADVAVNIASGSLCQVTLPSEIDSSTLTLSADASSTAQARVYSSGSAQPAFAALPVTVTNIAVGQAVVVEFSTGTVLRPQLESGSTAHGFARRSLPTDTAACQSLYELLPYHISMLAGNGGNATVILPFYFRGRKPTVPTLTNTVTSNPIGNTYSTGDITPDGFSLTLGNNGGNFVLLQGVIAASSEP